MKSLSGSAILVATAMLWSASTATQAQAESPNTTRGASNAVSTLKSSEFSSRRRDLHFGQIRHHRRSFALYRPYHYQTYYRPHYRAYYRSYYRPYRTFGFYRPWYRPYYRAYSRPAYFQPAYTYYRPFSYGSPYYEPYYGPGNYVSIGFGPFSFGLF
jgi:hypothetical protein